MKKKSSIVLNILIAIAGIGAIAMALYPTVANLINQLDTNNNIVVYNKVVQNADTSKLDTMWSEAKAFNKELSSHSRLFQLTDSQKEEYYNILDPDGSGLLGYVDIPKQNIHLSVYHGTSDEVLEKAVGHLEGTSFPTDGESVHAVITGHTGLPNLDLFTDIQKMEVGDEFTVTVLNRVLAYKVGRIDTVLPEEVGSLSIDQGENYCTLVTCTPYGINDHRLLVRGVLQSVEETGTTEETLDTFIYQVANTASFDLVKIAGIGIIVVAVVFVAVYGARSWKENRY